MSPRKLAVIGVVVVAGALLALGFYPRIKERIASARCRGAADCGACCAAQGCSFSEQTSDPSTGRPEHGTCACGLTASDSMLAAPIVQVRAAPVALPAGPVSDEGLGRPCELPADCGPGRGCMRFDDAGNLVLRQSAFGSLRCTRECGRGCPAGFHCSAVEVPVTGARPVRLSACGTGAAR